MKNVEFKKKIKNIEYKLRRRREEEEEKEEEEEEEEAEKEGKWVQANDALRASMSQAVRELR